jgi:alanyl-tRNA synthetase
VAESAVAAGVRRLEAVTADAAEQYIHTEMAELNAIRDIFKNPKNTAQRVADLQDENKRLQKQIEALYIEQAAQLQKTLRTQFVAHSGGFNVLVAQIPLNDANAIKTLIHNIEKEIGNAVVVFGTVSGEKAQITIRISDALAKAKGLNAGAMVRTLAKAINGGGGGQAGFATAGGTNVAGLEKALEQVSDLLV